MIALKMGPTGAKIRIFALDVMDDPLEERWNEVLQSTMYDEEMEPKFSYDTEHHQRDSNKIESAGHRRKLDTFHCCSHDTSKAEQGRNDAWTW